MAKKRKLTKKQLRFLFATKFNKATASAKKLSQSTLGKIVAVTGLSTLAVVAGRRGFRAGRSFRVARAKRKLAVINRGKTLNTVKKLDTRIDILRSKSDKMTDSISSLRKKKLNLDAEYENLIRRKDRFMIYNTKHDAKKLEATINSVKTEQNKVNNVINKFRKKREKMVLTQDKLITKRDRLVSKESLTIKDRLDLPEIKPSRKFRLRRKLREIRERSI
jgi:uncharacterized coiled-coil DUF342 family protein